MSAGRSTSYGPLNGSLGAERDSQQQMASGFSKQLKELREASEEMQRRLGCEVQERYGAVRRQFRSLPLGLLEDDGQW